MWWDFNIKICRRTSTCQVSGARCEVRGATGARCEVSGARCQVRGVTSTVRYCIIPYTIRSIYLAALPLGMGTQYWPGGQYTVCPVQGVRCEVSQAQCGIVSFRIQYIQYTSRLCRWVWVHSTGREASTQCKPNAISSNFILCGGTST